jgi:hypothetical protein
MRVKEQSEVNPLIASSMLWNDQLGVEQLYAVHYRFESEPEQSLFLSPSDIGRSGFGIG